MKFGVVIFPGSNCDEDIIHVLQNVMGQQVVRLWHKDHDLQGAEFIVLPGGFSFGDYLRSGAIARFSPIMQEVIQFAAKGGKVLGICNGFQILTEAGLLPGALLHNKNRKFICRNIHMKAQTTNSLVTQLIDPQRALKIPLAHGEGNYFADADVLKAINDNDQVLFRYCDEAGNITDDSNPNGSIENIAGVTNAGRNVFGFMPHPERASESLVGNEDGLAIFESILSLARA
ncbi:MULTISPECIES: phosphoribosylformylglycinamidine synthase subunit PurQ [Mucilaginibacter]|uniref:phosphoribosylformylglycinamidine synthase subunit PurQ n=1 Tax=Mucilaginibacter TaxID=423349 RepID=UPI0020909028|nr:MULTISPECIES: phosphoribosylformylglycinamidine synthase subunit PurQ [Mucilaginibacter]MCO5937276.1 phosphoribosylformylglycinamidine synthase subunit PurQ [Mucilaginibacter aurantiaciroseus]MEB0261656.1 phosphoribosylformylglycinamidine synthase subunit PurQ [Mucilaginibacter sp. 10I4]MEB0278521.1 phosphoribosylformylglycinamidine synthase subunit PurQ [Mucilaginibacter sp. 10B2]MEB0300741.1 phosphoribosylformylglycinamidine synthase subunit PurQ [Mucilaginibacter sp. 5C4]WPX23523.1 phosp